jgi:hypothetical protein
MKMKTTRASPGSEIDDSSPERCLVTVHAVVKLLVSRALSRHRPCDGEIARQHVLPPCPSRLSHRFSPGLPALFSLYVGTVAISIADLHHDQTSHPLSQYLGQRQEVLLSPVGPAHNHAWAPSFPASPTAHRRAVAPVPASPWTQPL